MNKINNELQKYVEERIFPIYDNNDSGHGIDHIMYVIGRSFKFANQFENIDLNKSHNRRDFGKGFYTTILQSQSKEWGYRLSLREKKKKYFVYEYLFEENSVLNVKRFDALSEEWLEFIKENRSKGGLQHNYDVVIGPVADDNTMETVQLYIANILTASEAVERLRYNKVNNQVSFHTEKALQYLQLIRRTSYARNDL